jgi:hypothetical protein
MEDEYEEIEGKKKKKVTSQLDPILEKLAIAFVLLVFLIIFAKTVFL